MTPGVFGFFNREFEQRGLTLFANLTILFRIDQNKSPETGEFKKFYKSPMSRPNEATGRLAQRTDAPIRIRI